MTHPTTEVLETLLLMEQRGELARGDRLPCATVMIKRLDMKLHHYSAAIWELAIQDKLDRIDRKSIYWGAAPSNVRSKEQIQLIILRTIAEGVFDNQERFPPNQIVADTFGARTRTVCSALHPIQKAGIVVKCRAKQYVGNDGQQKAVEAVGLFSFSSSSIESSVENCLERLERETDRGASHEVLRRWRAEHGNCVTLCLCSSLLCHFGVATAERMTHVTFRDIPADLFASRIKECRNWLRRNHCINESDLLMLAMAAG